MKIGKERVETLIGVGRNSLRTMPGLYVGDEDRLRGVMIVLIGLMKKCRPHSVICIAASVDAIHLPNRACAYQVMFCWAVKYLRGLYIRIEHFYVVGHFGKIWHIGGVARVARMCVERRLFYKIVRSIGIVSIIVSLIECDGNPLLS